MKTARVDGLTLAYRELGTGPPVLLVHGWPTSSFLWRNVMPAIARANRVVALDLPGFGASDKPPDAPYDFAFFERILDGFLDQLGIEELGLAGHDLGGPVVAAWTLGRPGRVTRLALLNTLAYPELSDEVVEFLRVAATPGLRETLTSPEGLEAAMRLGVADDASLSSEVIAAVVEPFDDDESRQALAAAGVGLELDHLGEIARRLPSLTIPLRLIYGEQDRILPDIAETMARLHADVPHAEVTALANCGHFLQEEAPEEVGELLAAFFAERAA